MTQNLNDRPAEPGRVLITGASGAVGPSIVHVFHKEGYKIRTFSLDPPSSGLFPAGVESRVGEITNREQVASAMQGIDSVVHLAALLHLDRPSPSMHPVYEKINVGGTANIVEAGIREKVKRIVFFSTINVYGQGKGIIHTEESSPNPDTIYARTKLNAENLILAAKGRDGQAVGAVLRLSAIYGYRVKGNYCRLLHAIAKRRFIPIGTGQNRRTMIYDRDVADAAFLAATHPMAAGQIYNVTDGRFYTLKEIILTLSELLGRQPPKITVPVGMARFLFGTLESGAKVFGKQSPLGKATINKYTEDMAVNGDRIISELGFAPRFDLKAGWSEVINQKRQNGEL